MRRVEVRRGDREGVGVGVGGDGLDGVVVEVVEEGGREAVPGVRRMRWK